MPRYKVADDIYNLPDDEVEEFLIQFPDAVLVEEEEKSNIIEDAVTIPEQKTEPVASEQVDTTVEPKSKFEIQQELDLKIPKPKREENLGIIEEKPKDDKLSSAFWEWSPLGLYDLITDVKRGLSEALTRGDEIDPALKLYNLGGKADDDTVNEWVDANKKTREKVQGSAEMRDMQRIRDEWVKDGGNEWVGAMLGIARNPSTALVELASSMALMVKAFTTSSEARKSALIGAGLGAGVGAGVGTVFAPITAPLGAIGGTMSGTMMQLEVGMTFGEFLNEETGNDPTPEKIRKILNDPEKLAEMKNRAWKRGASIAAIEFVTLGMAKGAVSGVTKLARAGWVPAASAGLAAGATIEVGGGMTGEAVGRFVADQGMDATDIIYEGISGLAISGPISMGEHVVNFTTNVDRAKAYNILKDTKYKTVSEAFSPESPLTNAEIQIAKLKNSSTILDQQVNERVTRTEITQDEGNKIKLNFRETQGALNQVKALGFSVDQETKAINLLKEKKRLVQKIDEVADKNLTMKEQARVDEIDLALQEVSAEGVRRGVKQVEGIIEKAGLDKISIKSFTDKAAIEKYYDDITEEVVKKESSEQGFIIQYTDGSQEIVINEDVAAKDQAVSVAGHEFLHALLRKTLADMPDAGKRLGDALFKEISKIDMAKVIDSKLLKRINQYNAAPENVQGEEVLTLFSDAIATGDIKFNENIFTKIGDTVRSVLQSMGVKVKFNNGRDVYNFIKDYNKSLTKAELTTAQKEAATEGITGKLVTGKVKIPSDTVIKRARAEADTKRSNESIADVNAKINQEILDANVRNADGQIIADESARAKLMDNNLGKVKQLAEKAANNPRIANLEAGKRKTYDDFFGEYYLELDALTKTYRPENTKGDFGAYMMQNLERRYGAVLGKLKKGEVEGATSIDSETAREVVDTSDITGKVDTKPTPKKEKVSKKVLSKQLEFDKVDKAIAKLLKDPNFKIPTTYKSSAQITPKLIAELFGVNPEQYVDTNKSLTKADVIAARTFINKNAAALYAALPVPATKQGKSTGISPKLLNAIYGAAEGRAASKLGKSTQGLKTREKMEKPPFDQKAFIKIFTPGKIMVVENQTAESGMIKALMKEVEKSMVNQAIRLNPDSKLTQQAEQKYKEGISRTLAAKKEIPTPDLDISKWDNWTNIKKRELSKKFKYDLPPIEEVTLPNKEGELNPYNLYAWDKKMPDSDITWGESRNTIVNDFLKSVPKEKRAEYRQILKQSTAFANKKANLFSVVPKFDKAIETFEGIVDPTIKRTIYSATGTHYLIPKVAKEMQTTEFKNIQAKKIPRLLGFFKDIGKFVNSKKGENSMWVFDVMVDDIANNMSHFVKTHAPINFYPVDKKGNPILDQKIVEEHTMQATPVGRALLLAAKTGQLSLLEPILENSYMQGALLDIDDVQLTNNGLKSKMDDAFGLIMRGLRDGNLTALAQGVGSLTRYVSGNFINPYQYRLISKGTTIATAYGFGTKLPITPNSINKIKKIANEGILQRLEGIPKKQAVTEFKAKEKLIIGEVKASKKNQETFDKKVDSKMTTERQMEVLGTYDKAAELGRSLKTPKKGISVFDFDNVLAKTNSKVLYTLPNGKIGELSASDFARRARTLEDAGAVFDFSQFSKIVEGKKGPLADLAIKRQGKFGSKDIFIVTARPQESAYAISEFLKGIGLDIPLANITGLENGTPTAKANWVAEKAAKGYNDFYFADDVWGNVKAVKEILDQIDVKSEVQHVKASKADVLNKEFNIIIEKKTGLGRNKMYSPARAKTIGASKGKWNFWIPYSAEDFVGLVYPLLSKGKEGDVQMAWFKKNLLDPFNRAENTITQAKVTVSNDFKTLKKQFPSIPKTLRKEAIDGFTYEDALRTYIWDKQGDVIPGLAKKDITQLSQFIEKDTDLKVFADELIKIQKGKPYPSPSNNWLAGTLTTDMMDGINKVNRKEYLQEWQENVDIIFSKENMNKLEATHGTLYVEALKNILTRMRVGTNKIDTGNRVVNNVLDWVNNSVGAIMFLNTRSAVLQTISAINYINWTDNNVLAAGKAFANQPQFWKDFMRLFNSDFLVARRKGLKINVTESEIADAAEDGSVKGVISMLLKKGFVLTRFADSFAIASGGATFYRNRINKLVKDGMSKTEAETKAFLNFYELSEEAQQSSRTDRISMQQASAAGRVILAFANTPMQYARLSKKAFLDLKNGRGDYRANISKLVYYSVVQNIIFNAIQNALFSMMFDDDDEIPQDKAVRTANGMMDSILRGLGIGGAAVATAKNIALKIAQESGKKSPKYQDAALEILDFSPPISSKVSKLRSAGRTMSWNAKEINEKGFSLDNPAYLAGGQVLSATTNIPLDRVIKKANNIADAVGEESEVWQKIALLLGWSMWELEIDQKDSKKDNKRNIIKRNVIKRNIIKR